jgi:hypothetical protein
LDPERGQLDAVTVAELDCVCHVCGSFWLLVFFFVSGGFSSGLLQQLLDVVNPAIELHPIAVVLKDLTAGVADATAWDHASKGAPAPVTVVVSVVWLTHIPVVELVMGRFEPGKK